MIRSPSQRLLAGGHKASETRSPAWIITFADLNSLLLAFFMLLFAFSEQDKEKFREIADSMRGAFGRPPVVYEQPAAPSPPAMREEPQLADKETLAKALKSEIDAGLIELEQDGNRIVIRIKEKGVFPSGSNRLEPSFEPIMRRLANTLAGTHGTIVVAGHTDSIPIANSVFSSNWQLSTARALAVAQVFFAGSDALTSRVHLESYAEFQPVDSNETLEGRARNRRVEISLIQPTASHNRAPAPTDQQPEAATNPPPALPTTAPPEAPTSAPPEVPTTAPPTAPHAGASPPPKRTPRTSAGRRGAEGTKGVAPAAEGAR